MSARDRGILAIWRRVQQSASSSRSLPQRLLGLDVGDRYVGVAVTDATNRLATPLTVVQRAKPGNVKLPRPLRSLAPEQKRREPRQGAGAKSLERVPFADVAAPIQRAITEHNVIALVVGLPLALDGSEDAQCGKVRDFMQQLRQQGGIAAPVVWWDERLTTQHARESLREAKFSSDAQRRREHIDKMVARDILQEFIQYAESLSVGQPSGAVSSAKSS